MSAKKFFYIATGLCLLAVAYSLGTREATASFVDHAATGPVIAITGGNSMLRSDGTFWAFVRGGWEQITWVNPLPVPISDIAFWDFQTLVTKTGVFWEIDTSGGVTPYPWANRGQIPLPPVSVGSKAWSAVKNAYRK